MNWFVWSLITLFLWGIWGIFLKMSTTQLDWKQFAILETIGVLIPISAIYLVYRPEINWQKTVSQYALIAGLVVGIAGITYYLANASGKLSLVVPITALYPVVTIVFAYFFLHEQITLIQMVGIVLALVAIILMAV